MNTKIITGYVFQCQKCKDLLYGEVKQEGIDFNNQFNDFFCHHFVECHNHDFPITVLSKPLIIIRKEIPSVSAQQKCILACLNCWQRIPLNPALEKFYQIGTTVCEHYWQCSHLNLDNIRSYKNKFRVRDARHFEYNQVSAQFVIQANKDEL